MGAGDEWRRRPTRIVSRGAHKVHSSSVAIVKVEGARWKAKLCAPENTSSSSSSLFTLGQLGTIESSPRRQRVFLPSSTTFRRRRQQILALLFHSFFLHFLFSLVVDEFVALFYCLLGVELCDSPIETFKNANEPS